MRAEEDLIDCDENVTKDALLTLITTFCGPVVPCIQILAIYRSVGVSTKSL